MHYLNRVLKGNLNNENHKVKIQKGYNIMLDYDPIPL